MSPTSNRLKSMQSRILWLSAHQMQRFYTCSCVVSFLIVKGEYLLLRNVCRLAPTTLQNLRNKLRYVASTKNILNRMGF